MKPTDSPIQEVIYIDVSHRAELDLSQLANDSTLYLKNDSFHPHNFHLENLSSLPVGTTFWVVYEGEYHLILTFSEAKLIPIQHNEEELKLAESSTFMIRKLDNIKWMIFFG